MTNPEIRNSENEAAMLCAVLKRPAVYEAAANLITADDFGWHPYGWCWAALGSLKEAGQVVDTVTLGDALERMGKLDEFRLSGTANFSGRAALSQLRSVDASGSGAESYAMTINDYAVKRKIKHVAEQMATWAYNGRTAADIVADVEHTLGTFIIHSRRTNTVSMENAVKRSMDTTIEAAKGERRIETGLRSLDDILGGLHKTDLVVVAGRPGQGKTGFLVTVAANVAKAGIKVLFFTIEMGIEQLINRFIAQLSDIPATNIRDGRMSDEQWQAYYEYSDAVSRLPITFNDLGGIRIGQIRTEARKEQADLIILDYIQLANADKKNERRDLDIGEITRGLKSLAKELDVPVLAAAQLSRGPEQRADKKPGLADLAESSSLEKDSDVVMLLHQPDPYAKVKDYSMDMDVIVAKHRNGPLGEAHCKFKVRQTLFVEAK